MTRLLSLEVGASALIPLSSSFQSISRSPTTDLPNMSQITRLSLHSTSKSKPVSSLP